MSVDGELLTGRALVNALATAGVGRWSPDAVRQWIREDPPCPIAEHADQGKPHRYRLQPVLAWLRDRALRERAKGFTRGDGNDLVERIDRALRGEPAARTDSATASGQAENFAANTSPTPGTGGAAGAEALAQVSQAKAPREQTDWLALSEADALRAVLQGRDPRNWKAAEEADALRRERLIDARKLIPVEELDAALDLHTEHTRKGIAAATQAMKLALRDFIDPLRVHDAERAIEQQHELLLQQLASTADLDGNDVPGAREAPSAR